MFAADAGNVTSAQFTAYTDPKVVNVEDVTTNLPDDWQVVHHVTGGELRVVMAGVSPVSTGELATITLKVLDPDGRMTLRSEGFVNENTPQELGVMTIGKVPTVYALAQNYPNPFNPMTQISYQLPGSSKVQLAIYNVFGQKVRTLVDGEQPAGFYSVRWDGLNDAGVPVSSGVYLYRIQTQDFTETKKMLFMK